MGCVKYPKGTIETVNYIRIIIIYILVHITIPICFCYSQDYGLMSLPDSAIRRIGKGYINDVVFFPDGEKFAVCSSLGIWVYDVKTGKELNLISSENEDVETVCFSLDGHIFAHTYGKYIILRDVSDYSIKNTLTGHTYSVSLLAFSPDAKLLASGSNDTTIRLWDVNTGKLHSTLINHTQSIKALAFSSDGNELASIENSGEIINIWDVKTGKIKKIITPKVGKLSKVLYSPNEHILTTSNWNGKLHFWNPISGDLINTISASTSEIRTLRYSQDGKSIFFGRTGHIRRLDHKNGDLLNTYRLPSFLLNSFDISNDGKSIVCGTYIDGSIQFFDVETEAIRYKISGFSYGTPSIVFSPDGLTLVSTSLFGKIINVYTVSTGEIRNSINMNTSLSSDILISSDGVTLSAANRTGHIFLWDIQTGEIRKKLIGQRSSDQTMVFSSDSSILYSAGNNRLIKVWDIDSGKSIREISPFTNDSTSNLQIKKISLSPNDRTLAVLTNSNTIELYDTQSNIFQGELKGHSSTVYSAVFSNDGRILGSTSMDNTIKLWDVESRSQLLSITEPTSMNVYSIAFSPNGRIVASGTFKLIRLWDIESGENVNTLSGHIGSIRNLKYSPDGKILASSSLDGSVILWDVTSNHPTNDK